MGSIKSKQKQPVTARTKDEYAGFAQINGNHPLKEAVPSAYVGYSVHVRPGGKVYYFNFGLAKEMGLIARDHPEKMNARLEQALLDTFSLEIINEYDVLHNTPIPKDAVKPNQYMATRYLQLQHPNRDGLTSGDGRSIWNGCFKSRYGVWDISSGGTGATRLSPASAQQKTFFKTGDKNVSYGCGRATIREGLGTAITSSIFHRQGIETERTLAVIGFKDGTAVNVRAARNLIRPAHFFGLMRRGQYDAVKSMVEYYIDREVRNRQFPKITNSRKRYDALLNRITESFARATAMFESEYIFCWLDWDGDNVLTNAGIIDYGTIRQFGLFHHEYRYEDVGKMSTTITEQKNQAKKTVQTFAQLVDYLNTGEKKPFSDFKTHPAVARFDACFHEELLRNTLQRVGFNAQQQKVLLENAATHELTAKFQRQLRYFEKAVSKRKHYKTADGLNRDAIFAMRDFLREMPQRLLETGELLSAEAFVNLVASNYASNVDRARYRKQNTRIQNIQETYRDLAQACAQHTRKRLPAVLQQVSARAALINRYERVTGDALIHVTDRFHRLRNQFTFEQLYQAMESFIEKQVLNPDYRAHNHAAIKSEKQTRLLHTSERLVKENREGI